MSSLVVPADLKALRQIAPWVNEMLIRTLSIEQIEEVMPGVELALQEVAVNIVKHGYSCRPEASFAISVATDDQEVRCVLSDDGPAYNPTKIPEPLPGEPQVGGYGMMIVRQLTTRFSVERIGEMNQTTLCFAIPPARGQLNR